MTAEAATITHQTHIRKLGQNSLNQARLECGLKPIQVRVRTCLRCGQRFESIDVWTCGCSKDY
jgi:hypothetical protein